MIHRRATHAAQFLASCASVREGDSLLTNEGGEPFRAGCPLVMGGRRPVLREKPPNEEAILAAGRRRETNDLG